MSIGQGRSQKAALQEYHSLHRYEGSTREDVQVDIDWASIRNVQWKDRFSEKLIFNVIQSHTVPVLVLSTVLNPLQILYIATGYGQGNHLRDPMKKQRNHKFKILIIKIKLLTNIKLPSHLDQYPITYQQNFMSIHTVMLSTKCATMVEPIDVSRAPKVWDKEQRQFNFILG